MPVSPTYPGVYIEEVASGVRTITGVPTSITAFVGVSARGPVSDPVFVNSYADYERTFGRLGADNPMAYSVFQYYQNGGSQAIIVRITGAGAGSATIALDTGAGPDVVLTASSSGAWGGQLRARVDYADTSGTDYNLTIRDMATGEQERYAKVSLDPNSNRRLDRMLESSALAASTGALDQRPVAHNNPTAVGADPLNPPVGGGTNTFTQATPGALGSAAGETELLGSEASKTGIYQLLKTDIFNILVFPPLGVTELVTTTDGDPSLVSNAVLSQALALCYSRRAMLVVDSPVGWEDVQGAVTGMNSFALSGESAKNAALYFPYLRVTDPDTTQLGRKIDMPPAGAVAGVYARTDVQRGVWKAPAGTDASLAGVPELSLKLTDLENGRLNPIGVNCLRSFPIIGRVVWGARTLRGADVLADDWKYVPVRRLALFIEESLYRGTQWVVFEPNDEPLWGQIRLSVGAFMQNLFRQGAFQGSSAKEAYFVKCDKDTTTQNHINLGIVNIHVGFAPLKPAEFVIIRIQQMAGQVEV
ncbi:MAG TPA: phage tail sheath C-terminal domain-containing protein [Pyrinomonadaceae bacterium]|nr:phage tail sheath C-terminal domain-containing protein [Pyrinomonadaceae bacterium]